MKYAHDPYEHDSYTAKCSLPQNSGSTLCVVMLSNIYGTKILNTFHSLSYPVTGTVVPRSIGKINDRALPETPASADNTGDGGGRRCSERDSPGEG